MQLPIMVPNKGHTYWRKITCADNIVYVRNDFPFLFGRFVRSVRVSEMEVLSLNYPACT